ncbi:hypothetical protein DN730_08140 [Marinomonas piezotolerans]|uniref:Uncharacterized protein n=1 Tax=Marinomonas piezotolerans TaxID=2213058 RepID=A0A370U9B2_9GAMM|nr:hypothetical protein [Marinomonas piezotolerans]RDL44364.1 hypothetical protein DN730_08140 [Marinomonas piezotolerans]
MTLKISNFAGIAPVVAPHKLSNGLSQTAKNVRLNSGALEAMQGNTVDSPLALGNTASIARYKPGESAYWFEFDSHVDLVPSLIFGSARSEMYWTDGIKPKRTTSSIATASAPYPSTSFSLGVPAPDGQIVAGDITGDEPESEFDNEDRVYVVTFVTDEGYEGAPSLPVTITLGTEQGCTISNLPTSASGNYNVTKKRIYRGTSATTELQFLVELDLATAEYADSKAANELGEALITYDFDLPPDDLMGLTVLPNGVLAGFNDNQLCFCEPFMPYAWPTGYRLTTESPIVGIAAIGGGLLVTTTGKPYLALGATPGSIQLQQMDSNQACVSKRSLVDVGASALYASPDGIVQGSASGVRLVGDALFSREQWQTLKPESIHAYYHDEKYIFFYDNGTEQGGYIFDPQGKGNALTELDFYATTGYNDLESDTLYLVVGSNIVAFQHGDTLTYTWQSAQFRLPSLMPYSVCRVIADDYPGEITVNVDGQTTTVEYEDDQPFRISAGGRGRFVDITLTGTNTVKEVLLGHDMGAVYG